LHTNGELNTIRYENSVAINGINLRKIRPELRDQVIIFDIERTNDFSSRAETELEDRLENLSLEPLGKIFDVLSKIMRYITDNPQVIYI